MAHEFRAARRTGGEHGGGRVLSEIGDAIVRLHAGNLGRVPTRARADRARDVLMVVREDSLTPVARTLIARGRGEQVLALRRECRGAMREEYIDVVARITGRRVRVFMSEVNRDPDIAVELFLLEPAPGGGGWRAPQPPRRMVIVRGEPSRDATAVAIPAGPLMTPRTRMTDDPFSVTTEAHGGVARARLAGELDLSSAPRLDEELRRAELEDSSWLVIDLRELQFMDSTGLRALLTAHSRAAETGRRLTLVVGEGAVGRLIELTGVRDIVECVDAPPVEA